MESSWGTLQGTPKGTSFVNQRNLLSLPTRPMNSRFPRGAAVNRMSSCTQSHSVFGSCNYFRHLQKRQDRTPSRPRSRATKRSLNLQQDVENQPSNMDVKQTVMASPPHKKFGTYFQHSRASVIKLAKNAEQDVNVEEHQEMGIERLQLQSTPSKSVCLTPHQLTPLQNVPLNFTSPVKLHSIQSRMKQTKTLPLPLIHPNLTVLENVPRNSPSAEQLLSMQNQHVAQLSNTPSSQYSVVDMSYPHVQSLPKFTDIKDCFTTPPRRIINRVPREEEDTLLGALALVELSQSPQ